MPAGSPNPRTKPTCMILLLAILNCASGHGRLFDRLIEHMLNAMLRQANVRYGMLGSKSSTNGDFSPQYQKSVTGDTISSAAVMLVCLIGFRLLCGFRSACHSRSSNHKSSWTCAVTTSFSAPPQSCRAVRKRSRRQHKEFLEHRPSEPMEPGKQQAQWAKCTTRQDDDDDDDVIVEVYQN